MARFSGDRLPQSRTGIAIALAERIDTLVGIFGIGQKPTGDKDPFALRRAALGALRIMSEHSLTLNLRNLLQFSAIELGDRITEKGTVELVEHFMLERLRGLYAERGVSGDLFDAVAAIEPPDLADFDERIEAVRGFQSLPEAEALAAANKRIGNILKKVEGPVPNAINPGRFELDAERQLHLLVEQMTATVAPLQQAGDYSGILKALAGLRTAVDTFFDEVMVMADDPAVRDNRLALLSAMQGLFLRVADVSLLQAPA
jgi:glycyl-tRNA synthetase beta chain